MLSEEIKQKEEEKLQMEEIPVPFYFDKYVACELRALGQRIDNLKESVDRRFADIDERFARVDERIDNLKEKHGGTLHSIRTVD